MLDPTPPNRPILDYAPPPRASRLRRWLKRLGLATAIPLGSFACLVGWLYWGWHSEQDAIAFIGSHRSGVQTAPLCPTVWADRIPSPFRWLVQRAYAATMSGATDADLDRLKPLTHLLYLDLEGCPITDAGVARLQYWPRLKGLYLDGPGITEAGLVHLNRCPALDQLALSQIDVTDQWLATLRGRTTLRVLYLRSPSITDAGLAHLEALPGLRDLAVVDSRVTPKGVARFQKALPNCNRMSTGFWYNPPPPPP